MHALTQGSKRVLESWGQLFLLFHIERHVSLHRAFPFARFVPLYYDAGVGYVRLKSINPEANRYRNYTVVWAPTLCGT